MQGLQKDYLNQLGSESVKRVSALRIRRRFRDSDHEIALSDEQVIVRGDTGPTITKSYVAHRTNSGERVVFFTIGCAAQR